MIQVIKYACCGRIFAASAEPYCYTDKDWQKDVRKYAKQGYKIEMVERADIDFRSCECNKKQEEENLFSEVQ